MHDRVRATGIDIIGEVPWGTHFCQFYESSQDLLDILVPYFVAGLRNNEFCMWITSEPLGAREAEQALRAAVPDLDSYLRRGQLEILPHSEWYLKGGSFDSQRVLDGWLSKLEGALARGHEGLRLSGNTFWLERPDWNDFTDYEELINSVIGRYSMLAFCTYCLDRCSASEVLDVIRNHQFALIKREGRWETIESSERKRLSQALLASEERYRRIVETAAEGIWTADAEGRITVANDRLAEMLGHPVAAMVGQPLSAILGTEGRAIEQRIREPLAREYVEQVTLRLDRRDGTGLWAIMSTSPIVARDGRHAGALGLMADITHLHDLQEQREDLLRTVSHDLRNPLTAIQGQAQLLERTMVREGVVNPRLSKSIDAIIASARQMGAMIEELVDAGHIESGHLRLRRRPVDLSARINESLERLAGAMNVGRVTVETQPELPAVEADPDRLDRILMNLVSNALKYSPEAAPVLVKAEVAGGSGVKISVADHGGGIPPEDVPHLFERYFRSKEARESQGLGLGLFITKGLVEAHGGKIWLTNQPGHGCTFAFTLPIAVA